jgi:hypothetical protein
MPGNISYLNIMATGTKKFIGKPRRTLWVADLSDEIKKKRLMRSAKECGMDRTAAVDGTYKNGDDMRRCVFNRDSSFHQFAP